MQSIEGTAKVRLNLSGTLVDVFCSVEVKMSDEDEQESSHAHFGTLQQTFSVAQTPPTFELPVRTLLAAKAAWDKDREAEIEYVGEGEERSMTISELPRNGAFTARPVFSVIAASSDGAETSGEENDSLALAEILRVATLPSKFLYRRVVAEVIGEATTILVSRSSENLLPDIVLDCERSVLTGSDGFFTWYDEAGHRAHRFTRETIPPPSIVDFQSTSDSVASICQHIDYLLQAFKYADPPLSQGSTLSSSSVQEDLELVEEVENEQGRFRAYRGGRVRVAFTDRTILQVERDGECCSFFFADGSTGKTTLSAAPLRHRAYIYQALEFGDWAFASQEERMQRHVKRQEAQAVVARELQRINVRCGMNKEFDVRYQQCISKDTSDSSVGQLMEQAQVKQIDRADPSLAMSLTAVQELQQATQQHIASVDQALRAAASATANDTQRHQ
ncbi:unnamed protein product [Phytophthora lilii]|uniref:Unnamed protein product n=1 Tax=Phytophthora lilii TaxID=2077276 RepID=A0A9W6WNB0_9STRA|nr:unnamed protein product [Phytophthora lilii]